MCQASMHIFGSTRGGSRPLLLLSSWCHAFARLCALSPLTGLYSLTPALSCALSDGVPVSSLFGHVYVYKKHLPFFVQLSFHWWAPRIASKHLNYILTIDMCPKKVQASGVSRLIKMHAAFVALTPGLHLHWSCISKTIVYIDCKQKEGRERERRR